MGLGPQTIKLKPSITRFQATLAHPSIYFGDVLDATYLFVHEPTDCLHDGYIMDMRMRYIRGSDLSHMYAPGGQRHRFTAAKELKST
jgi:hypothetical protein